MPPSSPESDASAPPSALDPSAEEIRTLGTAAVEWMARYYESLRERPVYPRTSAADLKARLAEPLPQEGRAVAELLDLFREVIVPESRQNGHPRSFGYVSAPGTAVASVADLLASTLNANLTAWRSAPAPVELSIFCFRYLDAGARAASDLTEAEERQLDALNERLLLALQQGGSSYLSNANLGGRFALRGCVLNYRTTRRDMEILLEDLRQVANTLPERV